MGKIDMSIENLSKTNNTTKEKVQFFSLKNNGDVATVRFCHKGLEDIEGVTLHVIKDDRGYNRKIYCLREQGDPIDVCPFCKYAKEHYGEKTDREIGLAQQRFFLTVMEYTQQGKAKKLWERGNKFKDQLISLTKRYNPLCSQLFELERQGENGATTTTYGIFPIPTREECPELAEEDLKNSSVIGSVVAKKTAEEMNKFIEKGTFLNNTTTTTATTTQKVEEPKQEPVINDNGRRLI